MTVSIRATDVRQVAIESCIAVAALLSLGNVHAHAAVIESAFINEDAPYPESHASTIVETSPGVLLIHSHGALQAVGRTRQGVNFQTWSRDGGNTWTPLTAIDLPNPNSGTDAITLRDGRHLMVYNHSAHRAEQAKGDRFPLDLAMSCDGVRWTRVLTLDSQSRVSGYAYPAVIQAADGLVHVTYTWDRKKIKHVTLDPAKLTLEPCT